MRNLANRLFYLLIVVIIVVQFFGIDKVNPPVEPDKDILSVLRPSAEIELILLNACYDCHSHQTQYPWYSNVAPISWLLKSHIDDGRKHLNFSTWANYSKDKANHKLEECVEMVETDEMPMKGYVLMHPKANLTNEQKANLIAWFKSKM